MKKSQLSYNSFSYSIAFIILIIIVLASYLFIQSPSARKLQRTARESVQLARQKLSPYETMSISHRDIGHPESEIYFGDAKTLYKMKLDGSKPEKVHTFPLNITLLQPMGNGSFLVTTSESVYRENQKPFSEEYRYELVSSETRMYYVYEDKPTELSSELAERLSELQYHGGSEAIFTEELPSGGADILSYTSSSPDPIKVGTLTKKIEKRPTCENSADCVEYRHPSGFLPSLKGSYLLNLPPSGGGLGHAGVVVSRDGSKIYPIDFYWYVSSAIWITDDKLLTRSQSEVLTLYTFEQDGSFDEAVYEADIGDYFNQLSLSPTGEYLLLEQMPFMFNMKTKERVQLDVDDSFAFLNWNSTGTMFLYTESVQGVVVEGETVQEDRRVLVYDVAAHTSHVIATLAHYPTDLRERMLGGKPVSLPQQFALK